MKSSHNPDNNNGQALSLKDCIYFYHELGKGSFGVVFKAYYDGRLAKIDPDLHYKLTLLGPRTADGKVELVAKRMLDMGEFQIKNLRQRKEKVVATYQRESQAFADEGEKISYFFSETFLTSRENHSAPPISSNVAFGFPVVIDDGQYILTRYVPSLYPSNLEKFLNAVHSNEPKSHLALHGNLSLFCARMLYSVDKGLQELHEKNLLHLDLELRNLMPIIYMDYEGYITYADAIIIDFGYARKGPEDTQQFVYERGKPANNPKVQIPSLSDPIRIREGIVSKKSDYFSYRILLYKMLADIVGRTEDIMKYLTPNPDDIKKYLDEKKLQRLVETKDGKEFLSWLRGEIPMDKRIWQLWIYFSNITEEELLKNIYEQAESILNHAEKDDSYDYQKVLDAQLFLAAFRNYLQSNDPHEPDTELLQKCFQEFFSNMLTKKIALFEEGYIDRKSFMEAVTILRTLPEDLQQDIEIKEKLKSISHLITPTAEINPDSNNNNNFQPYFEVDPDNNNHRASTAIEQQRMLGRSISDDYFTIKERPEHKPKPKPKFQSTDYAVLITTEDDIKQLIRDRKTQLHEKLSDNKDQYPNYETYKILLDEIAHHGLIQGKSRINQSRTTYIAQLFEELLQQKSETGMLHCVKKWLTKKELYEHKSIFHKGNTPLVNKLIRLKGALEAAQLAKRHGKRSPTILDNNNEPANNNNRPINRRKPK